MQIRHKRWLLYGASMVLWTLSAALVVWACQSPPTPPREMRPVPVRPAPSPQSSLTRSPPLQDFAPLWDRRLRRPLVDPPLAETNAQQKAPAGQNRRGRKRKTAGGLRLVGTMLDAERSLAVFVNGRGDIDLKGVGETLDLAPGTRVEQIELTQVTLADGDNRTILELSEASVP